MLLNVSHECPSLSTSQGLKNISQRHKNSNIWPKNGRRKTNAQIKFEFVTITSVQLHKLQSFCSNPFLIFARTRHSDCNTIPSSLALCLSSSCVRLRGDGEKTLHRLSEEPPMNPLCRLTSHSNQSTRPSNLSSSPSALDLAQPVMKMRIR